jgi:hypothetical protein
VKNVQEVELEFSRKLISALASILQDLGYTLPQSLQVKTSLLDATGRKKRSDASANNWSPESGRIEIRFEPAEQDHQQGRLEILPRAAGDSRVEQGKHSEGVSDLHPAETELLMALNRAESRPGWSFVPLKKFRDEILPQEDLGSMPTDVHHRRVLELVIEKKFVLIGKVPNPKSPQFPVTTIRLNRLMPEVRAILGKNDSPDLDFRPVEIPGEPLSATILRERR